eukprot:CAMPEP_0174333604 /NCGR_PEP_ID=MMETSP0810-20121108/19293_1 /TAXON_ID=73025 ORGANISM="Eutreptiella gymnastica-like, Strain CCMP1594" /NCGR_SAMPLE_ID=MMETSP0810 /ASSEMBLY_ACC=CAM_ASM_000659 /LENGTH=48 /DNA_ID= /DNA_START= /DNA_END= /DNA_ORIENTATION=
MALMQQAIEQIWYASSHAPASVWACGGCVAVPPAVESFGPCHAFVDSW